jgi:hypothetical protein
MEADAGANGGEGLHAPYPPPLPAPPPTPPPTPPLPVPAGAKVAGVVNWFNVAKGFGALRALPIVVCRLPPCAWLFWSG